jgi:hypothetical protein
LPALGELIMVLVTFGFVIKERKSYFQFNLQKKKKISAGYQKKFSMALLSAIISRNINADKEFYYRNTFHSRSWNLGCYE